MIVKKNPLPSVDRLKQYVRSHRVALSVLVILVVGWGAAGTLLLSHFNNVIAEKEAATQAELARTDKAVDDLTAKRLEKEKIEAERKAQELAEAEAAQRAEEEAAVGQSPVPSSGSSGQSASCRASMAHSNPASIDVLVNKKHCLQPLSFTPPDLVTTNGATISAKAAGDFNRMFTDAAAAGQGFSVSSSYRSYATQVSTYNYWVSVNGQAVADTVSARPGFSEHQTGLAVDVAAGGCNLNCFGGTSQYQWFQANAANYGFIQRYYAGLEHITGYASEEWHYRYVGVATAQDMKAKGIKTLEQYWNMQGGDYS